MGGGTPPGGHSWFSWSKFLEWVGLISGVLGIYTALNPGAVLPTYVRLPAGILLFAIAAYGLWVWGRRPQAWVKVIVYPTLAACVLAGLFLLCVLVVRFFSNYPPAEGTIVKEGTDGCPLTGFRQSGDALKGDYKTAFVQAADSVEVVFSATGDDRRRVKGVTVVGLNDPHNKTEGEVCADPREAAVLVSGASPTDAPVVTLSVALEQGVRPDAVNLVVTYRYGAKDVWWGIKRWVYEQFP